MVRRLVSLVLILAGTNTFTYAATRYVTTSCVLREAWSHVDVFLQDHGFMYGDRNADKANLEIPEEAQLASKKLMSAVWLSGGMYYWWNASLSYYGLAILLVAIGIMLPWVKLRKSQ